MAQTLIKIDYAGEKCTGIYYVDNTFLESVVTKENAPKNTSYKFVIRQTVTVHGVGKITAKETFAKHGISFYKALQAVIAKKPLMKERIIKKALGVNDDEAEQNALAVLTVDELWKQYKDYKENKAVKKRWSGSYAYTMASDYKRLVKPYIGDMRAMQVRREHLELCLTKADEKGLKARSDYSIVSVVKPMYDWWIDRKELSKLNPARRLELRELKNEVSVNLTWEQIENLYTVMYSYKDERYRQLFIWLSTGRRNGEALKLNLDDDVKNQDGKIIGKVLDGNYYTVIAANNKAGTNMIYRIPDGVTLPLRKSYVHTAPRDRNKQLQPVTVNSTWHNVRKLSGLPTIRKHDLRHILTTALKNSGVPLEIRSMVLGHTMKDITERYATDTKEGADLKHRAVTFFLDKVFGRISRDMMWDNYIMSNKGGYINE